MEFELTVEAVRCEERPYPILRQAYIDDNKYTFITISEIRALQPFGDKTKCWIKGKLPYIINNPYDELESEIIKIAGQWDKLGNIDGRFVHYEFIPQIDILRESDDTQCGSLCMNCGATKKIFHTNSCGCKIDKPFLGKLKKDTLSKQPIVLDHIKDTGIEWNSYNQWTGERTVRNITIYDGIAYGWVKVGGYEHRVASSTTLEDGVLKEERYFWYSD